MYLSISNPPSYETLCFKNISEENLVYFPKTCRKDLIFNYCKSLLFDYGKSSEVPLKS